jgi:signal transduction histidine kinase
MPGDDRTGLDSLNEGLADLVTDAVFVFDQRGRLQARNRVFQEKFGPSGGAACGVPVCEALGCAFAEGDDPAGRSAACEYCGWRQAAAEAAQGARAERECRLLTRSGCAHDLLLRAARQGDRAVCAVRDLYEAKRLRVLERAVFHDVLNHGVGIRGLSEMADLTDPEQLAEYMSLIQSSSMRMVDQMLWLRTLRGAEQGSLTPCASPAEAVALLGDVVARFREDAESRHVTIDVRCEPEWAVETDGELARLALGALLQNALEASRRGDQIRVAGEPSGALAVFRIASPAQLPDAVRAQLFMRSFSTKGAGRGVGVYGAKLVVEQFLGGRLWFDGAPAEGAVFGVTVPLVWSGA